MQFVEVVQVRGRFHGGDQGEGGSSRGRSANGDPSATGRSWWVSPTYSSGQRPWICGTAEMVGYRVVGTMTFGAGGTIGTAYKVAVGQHAGAVTGPE